MRRKEGGRNCRKRTQRTQRSESGEPQQTFTRVFSLLHSLCSLCSFVANNSTLGRDCSELKRRDSARHGRNPKAFETQGPGAACGSNQIWGVSSSSLLDPLSFLRALCVKVQGFSAEGAEESGRRVPERTHPSIPGAIFNHAQGGNMPENSFDRSPPSG
jgi:hypothetical protein